LSSIDTLEASLLSVALRRKAATLSSQNPIFNSNSAIGHQNFSGSPPVDQDIKVEETSTSSSDIDQPLLAIPIFDDSDIPAAEPIVVAQQG
jgi:hypothetical protein